ncbi:MAG TPA: hypothetical protein VMV49_04790 [Candidatus Deferrimicrobium sp.]|nr:hypothetical protein [Candidatus Deferrimicrobium sp.]
MRKFPSGKRESKKGWSRSYVPKISSPEQEYILTQVWHSLGKYDYTLEQIQVEPGQKMRVVRTLMRKGLIDIVGDKQNILILTKLGLEALKYDKWMHKYPKEELELKWQAILKYRSDSKEALAEMESIYHWQWQCAKDKNDSDLAEFFYGKWLETKEKLEKKKGYETDKKYQHL